MKNTQSKTKLIKTGKKSGATYWLGYKDFTDNSKPQEVKMTWEKNQTVLFVDLVNQDI